MTTEHDVYGMTPEERAAFEGFALTEGLEIKTGLRDDVFCDPRMDLVVKIWAACAKLNREKLGRLNEECDAAVDLLTEKDRRIKELEAENALLRADTQRLDWYFGSTPKGDFMSTFMEGMKAAWTPDQWRAAIDEAMKGDRGFCPELAKKQGFGEGSDKFWDLVDKNEDDALKGGT